MHAEAHYFSDRLTRELEALRLAKSVVVEAPSGYGKTTAVREYLADRLPPSVPVYWFTAADEEPSIGYRRLCREIERIDPQAGERLAAIGLPNAATVGEACDALQRLRCTSEAFLVIDNFHLLIDVLPVLFTSALLDHGGDRLHVVLLTQLVRRNLIPFMEGHCVAHITEAALRFSAADIRDYYAAAGLSISEQDAAHVAHNTGGWAAAVYLHLCALRERGSFSGAPSILTMMEHLVWDTLTERQQTFLLRISPLGVVTMQQACLLAGYDALPDDALEALAIPFIRYDQTERRYELHDILIRLLAEKRAERGAAFERDCLIRAGDLSREEGKLVRALDYYVRVADYERILSLDLSPLYLETIGDTPFYQVALRIAEDSTDEQMRAYPLSMLRIAFVLLAAGMLGASRTLLERIRSLIDGDGDEGSLLRADWLLVSSFLSFPEVPAMTAVLKQAAALFSGRRSRVVFPDSPWCYGIYSPVAAFHRAAGAAEREAAELEEYFALYTRLTGGHGSGADVLFRAEYAYYAGNTQEAEILAYKAAFVAQSKRQTTIQLASTFYLAWVATMKGDSAGWRNAFDAMMETSPDLIRRSFVTPAIRDIVRAVLLLSLGIEDVDPFERIREGDFSEDLQPDLAEQGMKAHLSFLLSQRNFARLVGTAEAAYPEGITVECFGTMYLAFVTAAGYLGLNNRAQAMELVRRAVAFALPSELYVQMVVYNQLTNGLIEECIVRDHPEYTARFCGAKEKMLSPLATVYRDMSPEELPESLTERERAVAVRAAQGLSNEEIAGQLFVSVNTVRTHLRAAFRKLDIDRRAKLAEKLR